MLNATFSIGGHAVVHNGYLPERTLYRLVLAILRLKTIRLEDRIDNGICFNSLLLPPYLKRIKSNEELLAYLYLQGIFHH
ncbi:MAG: hypothetical protein ACTS73_02980 [Arsenophonus sp. NEOnobi-MAG3]